MADKSSLWSRLKATVHFLKEKQGLADEQAKEEEEQKRKKEQQEKQRSRLSGNTRDERHSPQKSGYDRSGYD